MRIRASAFACTLLLLAGCKVGGPASGNGGAAATANGSSGGPEAQLVNGVGGANMTPVGTSAADLANAV